MFKIKAVKDWIKNRKIITVDYELQGLVEEALRKNEGSFNWRIETILKEEVEKNIRRHIVVEVDKAVIERIAKEMVSKYDLVKEIESITKERVTEYLNSSISPREQQIHTWSQI